MSISSILAFVLAGVAAKTKSVQVARRSEDRTRELEARIAELEAAIGAANERARRDQELIDIWRERALAPAGPDFRPPQIAQQQAAMMQAALAQAQHAQQLAQYNQQAAMNAQNFYNQGAQYQNQMLGQAVGLHGAQNLIDAELWCNCVPARHDMFLRGR